MPRKKRCQKCGSPYYLFNDNKDKCKDCFNAEYMEYRAKNNLSNIKGKSTKEQTKMYNRRHYQKRMAIEHKKRMIIELNYIFKISNLRI